MADDLDTEKEAPELLSDRSSKPWLDMLGDAEKVFQRWNDVCDNIDKLYADLEKKAATGVDREFQIFWANLEVLKPSIYSRPPVPVVVPRYRDRKPLPNVASEVLQRSLQTSFDLYDIDGCMIELRDDLALTNRAVLWLRYEAEQTDSGFHEKVCWDHLDRGDFLHKPARKWKEVGWVARRSWLTGEKGEQRFGEVWWEADFTSDNTDTSDEYKIDKKAAVWEIWSKDKGIVVWVTKGVEDVLDVREPWLDLEDFYPCPKPAYGTKQRRSLIPVPDFVYYRDQVEEINELTARISALSEALRLKGFYAAGQEDLSTAIERAVADQSNNSILIPVSNFAALGGAALKDAIVWLPVKDVAEVVTALVALRKQLIDDVYQITGLSDIMRGATDPNETLGAQELKSQYGSVRIRDRQGEMVRMARDITRIAAEIMAENFQPETLASISQIDIAREQDIEQQIAGIQAQVQKALGDPNVIQMAQQNPQQAQQMKAQVEGQITELQAKPTLEKVVELLRTERVRPYALDIETDSTIQPDENAEKQRRSEFLTALGGALGQLAPMVQAQPQSAEFAGEVLKFAIAPFRAGRELDAAVDRFVDQMRQSASQPKPDPEAEKAKAETQMKQQELQIKVAEMNARVQEVQAKSATASQQAQADLQKTGAEIQKIMAEIEKIKAATVSDMAPKPDEAA